MKKNLMKYKKEEDYALPELPEFIIHDILARIPCEYLNNTFRFICKSWYNEISSSEFTAQLAKRSKKELLIQSTNAKVTSLEMDEKGLDFKLNYFGFRRMGMIRSSVNGLILVNDPKIKGVQSVMNVVTKCKVTIPKCPSDCPHQSCGSALGYVPTTKEYKVVHIYADGFGFEIFTLGCPDNAWRRITGPFNEQHERPYNMETFSWSDPVSINGQVLHWHVDSNKFIISMNVSDEILSKTYLPNCEKNIQKHKYALLELDGNLSLVYNVSEFKLDVWILEDFHKQVWIKKHSITSELINYLNDSSTSNKYDNALPNFYKLDPVASMRNGEVLMFKHKTSVTDGRLYLYDIKQRELKKCKMRMTNIQKFVPYASSLISWKSEELLPKVKELSSHISRKTEEPLPQPEKLFSHIGSETEEEQHRYSATWRFN